MDIFNEDESIDVTTQIEESVDAGKNETVEPTTCSVVSIAENLLRKYGQGFKSFP